MVRNVLCCALLLLVVTLGACHTVGSASKSWQRPHHVCAETIGLWHLDSGPKAIDSSDNGLDGIVKGASWALNGRFGNCIEFTNHNAYVAIPDPQVSLPRGRFELWIAPADVRIQSTELIWAMASNAGWRYRGLFRPDRKFEFSVVDYQNKSASVISRSALPQAQWSHVAVEWNAEISQVKIFINGISDNSAKIGVLEFIQGIWLGAAPIEISTGIDSFIGRIDEVRLSIPVKQFKPKNKDLK